MDANGTLPRAPKPVATPTMFCSAMITFHGTVGEFFEEFVRIGGILRVTVHRHNPLVHLANAREGGAVGFTRRN